MDERPTPQDTDVPGGFPATPSDFSSQVSTPGEAPSTPHASGAGPIVDTSNVETPTQSRSNDQSYFAAGAAGAGVGATAIAAAAASACHTRQ